MLKKGNSLVFIIGSLVLFIILGFVYASPVLTDKQLFQHDIIQYKGGAKELLDYRAAEGKETYWSDSMFGGMPTYQMGSQFRGDIIKHVDNVLMFFPKPVNYIFLLFSGFFLLGLVAVRNWKYALLGATFFGLSTYFYIIISAGHNGKVHTIAYFAPLLAGILLVYIRKKYLLGFVVTTLFMGLQVAANHVQMTYYLFIALGFLLSSEIIRVIQKKTPLKHFLISSGIIAASFIIGIGMNSQRIMANAEYVKETVRGKQILNNDTHTAGKSGMDKESMLMWSYGKLETLNLFIPRLMGGGSQEPQGKVMMSHIQEMVQENVSSQEEMDRISKGFNGLTYWGDQPGTSGPAYQGAVVCFLVLLGFFFAPKKYRYWILGASILTIMLAWGSNFMPLSDFFIDFVPFYSKFRAPSSILVVVELLFPLIAIIGLYRFFTDEKLTEEYKKKILMYVGGGTLAFTLILLIFAKPLLGFYTPNEKTYLPPYILDYLIDERYSMFRIDALKTLIYIGIVFGVLWFSLKQKINVNIALIIIGLVSLFDLWSVNKRYLNDDNFVDKAIAENPFQTETSDLLVEKIETNPNLQSIAGSVNVNKTLETIAEKDKTHYRIFNNILGTFNETNTSYFKSSIGGYHAVKLRRYDDVINEYFQVLDSVKLPNVLNLLNTKYMVVGGPEQPQVMPNPQANGNAWFVDKVQFVNSPNEEIKAIGTIDSKKVAVVASEDKSYFQNKPMQADSSAFIKLTKYQANEIEFKSQSKTPQLAVFSEIYYPHGWKLSIDGKEVPYIKADYLLRAVHVPAGAHDIKMVFEPEVIKKGKFVSMLAFGLFIILSLGGAYFWFKKNKVSSSE